MNSSTTLMGIAFLCLFMAPILLVIKNQINKQKKLKNQLLAIGKEHNLNFNHLEITHKIMLGIDKTAHKLVATSVVEPQRNIKIINLQDLKNVLVFAPSTKSGIEKVAIQLEGSTEKELVFYEDQVDIGVDALVSKKAAKKWADFMVA